MFHISKLLNAKYVFIIFKLLITQFFSSGSRDATTKGAADQAERRLREEGIRFTSRVGSASFAETRICR